MMSPVRFFTVFVAIGLLSTPAIAAHPFHVSVAEVEWNSDSRRLEVALHVWASDLEKAIHDLAGEHISIDDDEADEWIRKYLESHLAFYDAEGDQASIEWLGKQTDVKDAWLYFEVPLESEPEGMTIDNRLLFESLEDQTNLVQLKVGQKRLTLRSVKTSPRQTVDLSQARHFLGG